MSFHFFSHGETFFSLVYRIMWWTITFLNSFYNVCNFFNFLRIGIGRGREGRERVRESEITYNWFSNLCSVKTAGAASQYVFNNVKANNVTWYTNIGSKNLTVLEDDCLLVFITVKMKFLHFSQLKYRTIVFYGRSIVLWGSISLTTFMRSFRIQK